MRVTRRDWIIDEALRSQAGKTDSLRQVLFAMAVITSIPFWFLPRALVGAQHGEGGWIGGYGILLLDVRTVEGLPVQIHYNLTGWVVAAVLFLIPAVALVNRRADVMLRRLILWCYCSVEKRVKRLLAVQKP